MLLVGVPLSDMTRVAIMVYGTQIFSRLGIAVGHTSQVSHLTHLSGLTETRYWEGIFLSVIRGPIDLWLFFRGRCGSPYCLLGIPFFDIFERIAPGSLRAFHALSNGATFTLFGHIDVFGCH